MGAILYLTKSYPIPVLARNLTCLIYGPKPPLNSAARLMMFGNFLLAIVVPLITVIYTNQDCFGRWITYWRNCQDLDSFDTSVTGIVEDFTYYAPHYDLELDLNVTNRSASIFIDAVVTTHDEICHPKYVADGRCPRATIEAMGDLYTKDLCFSAGLGTILTFIRASPPFQRAKRWVVRNICRRPEYESRIRVDRLVTGAALVLELPLVLGFVYPILPVLAAAVMLLNAGVFHFAATSLEAKLHEDPPAPFVLKYLWGALALGCTVPTWLFWECDFNGKWILPLGPLLTVVLNIKLWAAAHKSGHPEQELPHETFMRNKYMSGKRRRSPLGIDDPLWVPVPKSAQGGLEDDEMERTDDRPTTNGVEDSIELIQLSFTQNSDDPCAHQSAKTQDAKAGVVYL